jgi:hypothetical protein
MRAEVSSAPFIGELKEVERLTCAPRQGKTVRVAAWVVGAATTCTGAGQVRQHDHWLGGACGLGEQGGGMAVPGATHGPTDQGLASSCGPRGPRRGSVRDAGVARVGAVGPVQILLGPV